MKLPENDHMSGQSMQEVYYVYSMCAYIYVHLLVSVTSPNFPVHGYGSFNTAYQFLCVIQYFRLWWFGLQFVQYILPIFIVIPVIFASAVRIMVLFLALLSRLHYDKQQMGKSVFIFNFQSFKYALGLSLRDVINWIYYVYRGHVSRLFACPLVFTF